MQQRSSRTYKLQAQTSFSMRVLSPRGFLSILIPTIIGLLILAPGADSRGQNWKQWKRQWKSMVSLQDQLANRGRRDVRVCDPCQCF